MGISVLCPSRGNPGALIEAYASFKATRMGDSTFVAVIDTDDPTATDYVEEAEYGVIVVPSSHVGNMNRALNWAAVQMAEKVDVIGFVGDDHRFRTPGWDRAVESVLEAEGGGILYGDDLAQRESLPTQVFISATIIKALGWMGLPGAKHLYLDNTWKMLGEQAGCLIYVPDIVIEHMHPAYGKGEWDENHRRVNASAVYEHDQAVYEQWLREDMERDVSRVREALVLGSDAPQP